MMQHKRIHLYVLNPKKHERLIEIMFSVGRHDQLMDDRVPMTIIFVA